jgi:hypothetical protein
MQPEEFIKLAYPDLEKRQRDMEFNYKQKTNELKAEISVLKQDRDEA